MVDRLRGAGQPALEPSTSTTGPGTTASAVPPPPAVPPEQIAAVWARVQLARNQRRPHALEFLEHLSDEFVELHGDRVFGDDPALVGGLARIAGRRVVVIGQQKGADTDENIRRSFGMPHPEGYRKAVRLMQLAERLGLPVVTLIDTPGAHPGAESEERGVAEAIASAIGVMTSLRVPIVAVITGEGGSGGALAIAVGDVVLALENAVYSVISPEGCASILWRTPDRAPEAAVAMRMTAREQQELGVVDVVIPEPGEGAHTDPAETARRLRTVLLEQIDRLAGIPPDDLVAARYRRYRVLGAFTVVPGVTGPGITPERPGLAERLRTLIETRRQSFGSPPPGGRGRDEPPARDEV